MGRSMGRQTEQGFSMLDVLAAVLVTMGFTLGALQMMVLATFFSIQAKVTEEADLWVQQDLESVFLAASNLAQDNSRCLASTYSNGYAQQLSNNLSSPVDREISAKTYRLERTYDSANSVAPHKVLRINYQVRQWDGSALVGDPIVKQYVEVIPDAALQCP